MRVLLIIIILSVAACSTSPTGYVPMKDKQGYDDSTVENELRLATFQGNSATKKETAELFAKFRAIEVCNGLKRPYTHFLVVKDKTYSKEITQASTTGPSYYYGASPYYGYGGGMGMSYGTSTTTVSNETYTYPLFEVYFECVDKPMDARMAFINLSQSQMQNLVKDLQGAVQVDDVLKDSPNQGKLQKGDIIISGNGERITSVLEAYRTSRRNMDKKFVVEFFRDGIKKQAVVSYLDVTAQVDQAQKEIIKEACKMEGMKETQSVCK